MARIDFIFQCGLLVIANSVLSEAKNIVISEVDSVFRIFENINAGKLSYEEVGPLVLPEDPQVVYLKLSERLGRTSAKIPELGSKYTINSKVMIEALIEKLQISGSLRISMDRLLEHLVAIDGRFEKFTEIYVNTNKKERKLLEDFFGELLSNTTVGLEHVLEAMYQLNEERNRQKLFDLLSRHLQDIELTRCDDPVSSQQHIHNLFSRIVMQEMDAFIMIVTGYSYFEESNNNDYKNEINRVAVNTRGRLIGYIREALRVMAEASTQILRCGPTTANRTRSIEVKGPLQGIVIDDGLSNYNCESDKVCVSPNKSFANLCTNDVHSHSNKDKCLGQCYNKMIDCEPMSEQIKICEADSSSNRRYDYIKTISQSWFFETDVYFGKKIDHCNKPPRQQFASTAWKFLEYNTCSFCMCTCTGNGWKKTDVRAISLMLQTIDFRTSKAIIGVRFFEDNGMIHLQIKEGILLPGGKIQNRSEKWQPINYVKRTFPSEDPQTPPEYYYDDANLYMKLYENLDYIHISEDYKTVSLSEVNLPNGYLVTGVGFRTEGNPHLNGQAVIGTPIELLVEGTPFDFKTAKYIDDFAHPVIYVTSSMFRPKHVQRKRIEFQQPDVSIHAPRNDRYSGSEQIVDFRVTDYRKDAGQTIIPFIDTRPVEATVPLSGIGLYLTGSPGYGGFIAPKIFTFDTNNNFAGDMTSDEVDIE